MTHNSLMAAQESIINTAQYRSSAGVISKYLIGTAAKNPPKSVLWQHGLMIGTGCAPSPKPPAENIHALADADKTFD